MNTRLDTLLRKQLSHLDYVNVRFCEICVVVERKKIDLRYLILTNSALWSCEYPNPKQLTLFLDLGDLRKIIVVHDFPVFLSGKYRQNCLHLQLLLQKPMSNTPVTRTVDVFPNESRSETSEVSSPKFRKVSLMVTLLKRWTNRTLQRPDSSNQSDFSSNRLFITNSVESRDLWSEVRNGIISPSITENITAAEDHMASFASLPCSIPDRSLPVFEKMAETAMNSDVYILKGDSQFYHVLQLTWKSCLLNNLACRNTAIPKRNQWQSLWDSQKRLIMNMPEEIDVSLEKLTMYLRRWPVLKFYVWKDVSFVQHLVKSCQRYISPPEFSLWHAKLTQQELSVQSQRNVAQILRFFAECLRSCLVPKIFYEVRNTFHKNLLECCLNAARCVYSRTNAVCCAFEVLHSWQEGQALRICGGNLFAMLSTDLQELFAKLVLEDISNFDWQFLSPDKHDLLIRNGTFLSVLLENSKAHSLATSDSYKGSLRLMASCELNSPLRPFWEPIQKFLVCNGL